MNPSTTGSHPPKMRSHQVEIRLRMRKVAMREANSAPAIVALKYYPSTVHAPRPAIPAALTNVNLSDGELSGEVMVRYHPEFSGNMNEFQTNTYDPNNEAGWKYAGMRDISKAMLSSNTPGVVLWVRVRTADKGEQMDSWSDPAQIRVP